MPSQDVFLIKSISYDQGARPATDRVLSPYPSPSPECACGAVPAARHPAPPGPARIGPDIRTGRSRPHRLRARRGFAAFANAAPRFRNRNKFAPDRASRSHSVACAHKNSGGAQKNGPQRIRKRADEVHTSERNFFREKIRAHRRGEIRADENACNSRAARTSPRRHRECALRTYVSSVAFIRLARLR